MIDYYTEVEKISAQEFDTIRALEFQSLARRLKEERDTILEMINPGEWWKREGLTDIEQNINSVLQTLYEDVIAELGKGKKDEE